MLGSFTTHHYDYFDSILPIWVICWHPDRGRFVLKSQQVLAHMRHTIAVFRVILPNARRPQYPNAIAGESISGMMYQSTRTRVWPINRVELKCPFSNFPYSDNIFSPKMIGIQFQDMLTTYGEVCAGMQDVTYSTRRFGWPHVHMKHA